MHCFHGQVCFIEVNITDLDGNQYINIYDCDWVLLPIMLCYPNSILKTPRPFLLEDALFTANELSKNIDYCCIDIIHGVDNIYFIEISLSPSQGKVIFSQSEWDFHLGKRWNTTTHK